MVPHTGNGHVGPHINKSSFNQSFTKRCDTRTYVWYLMQQKEGEIVCIATNNQDIRMASEALFRAIAGVPALKAVRYWYLSEHKPQ